MTDVASTVPLVDHHCHGVVTAELDRPGLEAIISEGGAPPAGETNFDTPVGLAIRRHCAPLLDLEPHAPVEEYLARRFELGTAEVNRRFLAPTGTSRYLVDTGHRPDGLTTPEEMAALTGTPTSVIVRLESVAEAVAAEGVEPGEFAQRFADRLAAAAAAPGVVGVKSVAAYRTGLRLDPRRPSPSEATGAAARWLAAGPGESGWRLADPVLQRVTLWAAVDLGLPIQFHIGFGDSDIRMTEVDPTLLTDWLHQHRVPVMLLHCWPLHREASYLACIYPHVHLDVGSVLHYVGPRRSIEVLAEAAEVTPFTRLLYSSDAYGAPELYLLGALTFRVGLAAMLADRVGSGEWSAPDAERFAHLVAHGNAERVYGLPAAP
ncbi:amidohydrolase family protein [Kineosporia sp. R_H_3]|uniref:amidohydrolase family protein n=1 Tax=Kineosporia sp. R_H_3 TaxID=1961848 RepID=UPI000B4B48F8|nr:amidohydrolase family protein [Kineosporia sp. R_H_3]